MMNYRITRQDIESNFLLIIFFVVVIIGGIILWIYIKPLVALVFVILLNYFRWLRNFILENEA